MHVGETPCHVGPYRPLFPCPCDTSHQLLPCPSVAQNSNWMAPLSDGERRWWEEPTPLGRGWGLGEHARAPLWPPITPFQCKLWMRQCLQDS